MSRDMKWVFTLILLLFISSGSLRAQETGTRQIPGSDSGSFVFLPYHKGIIDKNIFISPEITRLRPSPAQTLKNKINSCLSIFSEDTLFRSIKGLRIAFTGRAMIPDDKNSPFHYPVFETDIGFHSILSGDTIPVWLDDPDAWLTVYFNNPLKLAGYPIIHDIYEEPVITGEFFGHREYHRISSPHRMVAVKNNPGPLYEPVSREDFLLSLISYFQVSIEREENPGMKPAKESEIQVSPWNRETAFKKFEEHLKEIRKYDPLLAGRLEAAYRERMQSKEIQTLPANENKVDRMIVLTTWREAVRKLKAEMNAMSPLERKSQAWWSNSENSSVSGLTPASYFGSRPLVRINKNLIDKSRSPATIQLIVMEWPEIPFPEIQDQTGYYLACSKLQQLMENHPLWNQVFNLLNK